MPASILHDLVLRVAALECFGNTALIQGPIVYGAKLEDRFKPSDKVKVILASATLMNKTEGRGAGADKAWNHCAETRIKAGEDDKLLVLPPLPFPFNYQLLLLACMLGVMRGTSLQLIVSKCIAVAGSGAEFMPL